MLLANSATIDKLVYSLSDIRKSSSYIDCPFHTIYPSIVFVYSDNDGHLQVAYLTDDGDLRLMSKDLIHLLLDPQLSDALLNQFQAIVVDTSCIVCFPTASHR